MSIFKNLLDLNPNKIPLEDFFTEIFAYLLKLDSDLLDKWLQHFNISNIVFNDFHVSTQESFVALDNHLSGSRPDIFIELSNKTKNELIFIECKIGSQEGNYQLQRYAEHLDGIKHTDRKYLIYITRDFDSKDQEYVFENCNNLTNLAFIQLRWYQCYQFLLGYSEHTSNLLIKETLAFMEENGLSGSNRFTSVDILAITNFPRVRKMMEETMNDQVANRFETIAGGNNPRHTSALRQLKDHDRYVFLQEQADKFEIILGYSMDGLKIGAYPEVGLTINVSPNATERNEIMEVLKKIISKSDEWKSFNLNETNNWAGICRLKSLECFLNKEDHVISIQSYFLSLLDELDAIKEESKHLKWLS